MFNNDCARKIGKFNNKKLFNFFFKKIIAFKCMSDYSIFSFNIFFKQNVLNFNKTICIIMSITQIKINI